MNLSISPLHPSHNKKDFSCGKKLLDDYLHLQAKQDVKKMLAVCFVLNDEIGNIKGYYTLSNTGISRDILPVELANKFPKSYTNLPATLLGRLAVDKSVIGKGYGEFLLMDAITKCFEVSKSEIGSIAIFVDPIDKQAIQFYEKYGFILLPDSGKMFLAMKTISELF
ncbi:MAG: GNAT family N-acetyltransferase [Bacteroidales bacterium]|nr:GNAT family N-acetyltransferase [Bacteroidales bacterium]